MRGSQNQLFHCEIKFLAARGAHVGLGGLRAEHALLRTTDAIENRCVAAEIAENPDAEIDFLGSRIGAKCRH